MRTRRNVISLIVVFCLAALGVLGLTVFHTKPQLGLDLRGGLSVVLSAEGKVNTEVLDRTVTIIRDRVDSLGAAEPDISRSGNDTIIVQLPEVKDPERALQIIGKTAQLRFRPVGGVIPSASAEAEGTPKISKEDDATAEVVFPGDGGDLYELGPAALAGDDIRDARAQLTQQSQWIVQLDLTREGTKKFADITRQLAPGPSNPEGRQLAIVLDQKVESAPTVQQEIPDGQAQISGTFSEQEAKDLALVLRTGALPIELEPQTFQKVSPTLGSSSLKAGLIAGAIGLAAVALYMLAFYRLLGLITLIGLGLFGAILLGLIGFLGQTRGFTLTLAGIAGIIVSIGIAADSYIIYFERIKDELKEGKTFRSAVERGFRSAIRTNLAANGVAFMAALILYLLAVGPVRGFALTLGMASLLDIALLNFYTHPIVATVARSRKKAGMRMVGVDEAVAAT